MSDAVPARRARQRVGDLLRASHPRQAVFFAAAVGILAAVDGRPGREALSAAAAVLVVQLALGLDNDLADAEHDYRAQTPGKPIAGGLVEPSSASYWMAVLILLAIPLSVQNGAVAGAALLATLPIGWLHNHLLHRGPWSFVGWTLSFGLVPAFLAYGGWAGGMHGSAPTWAVTVAAAALGFCVHLVTTLGDLVTDNKSGARNLPLRIALRIGAPRLLLVTVALTALSLAGLVLAVLSVGLRQ
ncbi:UbiA family prenyltransferase [Marmoricola sp. RAF53]|uniref:UbiA family prenyltransferase n=1 Tax=Marmoricola sp. RAF53 TaxID=3233059 RepID=UPI003F985E31